MIASSCRNAWRREKAASSAWTIIASVVQHRVTAVAVIQQYVSCRLGGKPRVEKAWCEIHATGAAGRLEREFSWSARLCSKKLGEVKTAAILERTLPWANAGKLRTRRGVEGVHQRWRRRAGGEISAKCKQLSTLSLRGRATHIEG